jgi:hypothetical protein
MPTSVKSKKAFSEADVQKLLAELRAHGFGELNAQIVNGEIVRVKKTTTHEPSDN